MSAIISKTFDNNVLNIDEDLIKTSKMFGISLQNLSSLILSNDKNIKIFVNIIYNLSQKLKEYSNRHLPEQLLDFINYLQNYSENQDILPSHLKLLSSERQQSIISIQYFDHWSIKNQHENSQDENNNPNCNHTDVDEYNHYVDYKINDFHQLNLVSVHRQYVKNDVCILCFLQLTQNDTVQTKCGHQYHRRCIEHWIQIERCCIVCKQLL